MRSIVNWDDKVKENVIGGACERHGEEQRCIQKVGDETCGKDTTWKVHLCIGG
jgi:hypothetical protein